MKTDEILILAKAGFTAEQIAALSTADSAPVATPPVATPPVGSQLEQYLATIAQFTAAMQANGILNSRQPTPPTTEDILASIVDPTYKPKEGI